MTSVWTTRRDSPESTADPDYPGRPCILQARNDAFEQINTLNFYNRF